MGSLELIFAIIIIFIVLVAFARGYPSELGNTVIILASIFVLSFFEARLIGLLNRVGPSLVGSDTQATNFLLSAIFTVVFISAVFASYAGITLDFPGRAMSPPLGPLLTLAVGLLNGYLIAGTLWYYQDRFQYPSQLLGTIQLPLTATGQTLVQVLPQRLFESPVYWMIPVAVLIIWRVRG